MSPENGEPPLVHQVDHALFVGDGHAHGHGRTPSRFSTVSMERSKLAPGRSILFTKMTRGMSKRLAWRHTVSVWGSTRARRP